VETEVDTTTAVVRPMRDEDWPGVRAVYLQGIATGNATFETMSEAQLLGLTGRDPR
jgi:hypothetical protein